ncbi:hypothetical protein, partial [Bosea sp. TAB14]|uniref:hypothetical protein n=1 Tax=Bosea sp. TAB14 TaxID=3237481 RepID=UPI003F93D817
PFWSIKHRIIRDPVPIYLLLGAALALQGAKLSAPEISRRPHSASFVGPLEFYVEQMPVRISDQ